MTRHLDTLNRMKGQKVEQKSKSTQTFLVYLQIVADIGEGKEDIALRKKNRNTEI